MGSIQGAPHAERAAVEDVGVDHGGGDVAVAEEFLDGADVVAGLEQVRSKAVAKAVAGCALGELCLLNGTREGALDDRLVQVVPALCAGLGVLVASRRGEHPLPRPRLRSAGRLLREGAGQGDTPGALGEVLLVQGVRLLQLLLECCLSR